MIHDLFRTELGMIFPIHVGLTDSVLQRMQFFFLTYTVANPIGCIFPVTIIIIFIGRYK
jgi:hypothetical protein